MLVRGPSPWLVRDKIPAEDEVTSLEGWRALMEMEGAEALKSMSEPRLERLRWRVLL